MNQLIIFLQVVYLIVFLDQFYTNSNQELDSGSSESNDEVNPEFNCNNSSLVHVDTNSTKTKFNFIKGGAGNKENHTRKSETGTEPESVAEMASKMDTGCPGIIREEDDDDDSKSSLVDYPFSVSIQKKGSHYVSGALIDKNWILSVAGELYNQREALRLFRVRLGSVDCKRGGILEPLKKIEIHPYYIYGKPNFDVSLLRMASPVTFTDVISPIEISNINGKVLSAKFLTTYWPRIVLKGKTLPTNAKERTKHNSMRVSTQRLISEDICQSVMTVIKESINESVLCLKPVVTHHSACMVSLGPNTKWLPNRFNAFINHYFT